MNSISPNLNVMIKASEKASKILIRDFGEVEKLQVSIKGPADFVSTTDTKVEKIIIDELSKARKDFSILSEESGYIKKKDQNNVWIIDPIDGTTNFLHGVPHFAISIALKSNDEIISGVIYDPIKDEIFYGEKNSGAFFNNKRIRVSKKKKLDECLFACSAKDIKTIEQSIKNKTTIRNLGSAALDIAYVAAGRYDAYFQKNVSLWDIAAGIIILKEAGGYINNLDLNKYKNVSVVASNSSINEKLRKSLSNF